MDGIDAGVVLGAAPDNSLTLPSGLFSTDVDEMDIGYVCKNACIASPEIAWNTTSAVGTKLFACPVTPGYCQFASPEYYPTLLAFVSSCFERWTGGIRYRLAVSKTAFHSGKLRISYHPNFYTQFDTTSVYDNVYSWILDLSISSDLDFTVPYVSNTQWKEVRLGDGADNKHLSCATGIIVISVMTPLVVANAAASVNAPMYLWTSAADDFSLAVPSFPRFVPAPVTLVDDEPLEAQIFNETSVDAKIHQEQQDQTVMLFKKSAIDPTMPEQVTIGEKITNLRQLIKRFCKTAVGLAAPYPSVAGTNFTYPGPLPIGSILPVSDIRIDPAFLGDSSVTYTNARANNILTQIFSTGATLDPNDAVVSQYFQSQSALHYLSYIYTFWTGSHRYKIFVGNGSAIAPVSGSLISQDESSKLLTTTYSLQPRSQIPYRVFRDTEIVRNGAINPPITTIANAVDDRVDGRFESVVYPDLDGCLEFTVPYYSNLPISLITQGTTSNVRGPLVARNSVRVTKGFSTKDTLTPYFSLAGASDLYATLTGFVQSEIGAYVLYEAAGDDFSYGYLHGAPTLYNTRAYIE
jgi:hypothetical protein